MTLTLKEKLAVAILDKIDKNTLLDYVWECYYDEINEMVIDSHVN